MRLRVEHEMLDDCRDALCLHAPHVLWRQLRAQSRFLPTHVLGVTPVTGDAVHVDAWAEDLVTAVARSAVRR